jgi:hypothetical protein
MKEQTFIQKGKKGGTKKRGPTSNQETTSKNANPPMGVTKESSKDLLEGAKITTYNQCWAGMEFQSRTRSVSSGSLTRN